MRGGVASITTPAAAGVATPGLVPAHLFALFTTTPVDRRGA